MRNMHEALAYAISIVTGAMAWLSIAYISNHQEAWDSELYYYFGLPLMAFVTGIVGLMTPVRVWRWGIATLGAQAVLAVIQNPTANMLPLGLITFAFLSIPCILTAYFGAYIRQKVWW